MTENTLLKLFEHNNWANAQIIQICSRLRDAQLDAEPNSATKGSIRLTLWHLVSGQVGYLSLLTGSERHFDWQAPPNFNELQEAARTTGEGLLALAQDPEGRLPQDSIPTSDRYLVKPWVIMVQVINHATEHREQIKSMLTTLGVSPPDLDGWTYGEAVNALVPLPT